MAIPANGVKPRFYLLGQYCNPKVAEQNESDGFVPRARRKAQAVAKAVRLRKGCNAAMGAKTRFHVSLFSGCSTSPGKPQSSA
jgi:hypothetical protein